MSAIKKVIAKVTSPGHSPTSSTHDASLESPKRSRSPSSRSSSTHSTSTSVEHDGHTQRDGGRKPNRVSSLISHIRPHSAHSKHREPFFPVKRHSYNSAHATNGFVHKDAHPDETAHSHQIVRPSSDHKLSMTEEKVQRQEDREVQDEHAAQTRKQKHLEAWKIVRRQSMSLS
ncbi:uncharacterized protein PHACADRAFT_254225 [Phanerochaete carnosa HHB-10118-sp]|uniref:Uncharacterized protein n=1 Tax=Phanerochaete carnosa (strain HHB-10118-sp) TaxID=650164 RepID=K5WCZ2_PHACS|nr:uncharacterized protein PHACADRAFT_254225 [Phanerochaete carnosa HHB-10118-sp]EKM56864.1 hypothetical protein PHACADRAFT_254225 [Phanerochaete carnosa HHB-10118-sp]